MVAYIIRAYIYDAANRHMITSFWAMNQQMKVWYLRF